MIVVLGIYLSSIAISYGLEKISERADVNRLNREGYKLAEENITNIEKFRNFLEIAWIYLLPGINIMWGCYTIFNDNFEEELRDGLRLGYIVKKTEEELEREKKFEQEKENLAFAKKQKKISKKISEIEGKKEKELSSSKIGKPNVSVSDESEELENENLNKVNFNYKAYSQMSNSEKLHALEVEKAFLLSQEQAEETKSYNDRGAYSKK